MKSVRYRTTYLIIALLILGIAPVIRAEVKPWNASDVLQLSDDLFAAARRLAIECRTSPPRYDDTGDSSGHLEFRYHVRHFMSVSNDLSQALEDGKSMVETQPIFKTLINMMPELKRYSEKKAGGPWPVVSKAVMKVDGIVEQLAPYYASQ
jgi:hypothetical protein